MISSGNDVQALKYIETYTRQLKETFYTVHEIFNSCSEPLRALFILNRLGNFWPLLIKSYKLDKSLEKVNFGKIAKLLTNYSFRVYAINQSRGNTGQSRLFNLAKNFDGNFDKLCNDLTLLVTEYCDDKAFKTNLSYPNLYNWINGKDLNYFFWKYENYLRKNIQPKASPMSEQELTNDNSKFKLSIEHIACQNPRKLVVNDSSILPEIDDDFEENYLHSIGNLTIDPFSANASKGNLEFESKNSGYFLKAPFKAQNELEEFLDNGKWTSRFYSPKGISVNRFCSI
ncbi:HNH endonuclease family protein [Vibrio parahaemolyticus]|nr:HNH endonuclease family protein [Vibrio parahaemolyticus]